MPPKDNLDQIDQELQAIANAEKVPVSRFQPRTVGQAGRCHVCGSWSDDLVEVPVLLVPGSGQLAHPQRMAGVTCGCGIRYL